MDTTKIPPIPKRSKLREAFRLRSAQYPWKKAIGATVTMVMCLLVGLVTGHTNWGMFTVMGAFTSLYVHNEPYFVRARKLALVAIGLAAAFAIGTLSAGSYMWMAISLGFISAIATYLCGAWKVPTPSAYFFILACAVGTGMPVDHAAAPMRGGLALLGGGIAWVVSMLGWFVNAYGPETTAVTNAYRALSTFLATIGDVNHDLARHQAIVTLRSANDHVRSGELRWRSTTDASRLFKLVQKANEVFSAGIALSNEQVHVHPSLANTMRVIADTISQPDRTAPVAIPRPTRSTPTRQRLVTILNEIVDILAGESKLVSTLSMESNLFTHGSPRLSTVFKSTLTKHSLVLPSSLRIGIAVMLATWVAIAFGNGRPYWVPLTVAAVLQGATVIASVHRTLQRAIGTSIGVILGVGVITYHPTFGYMILIIMVLQLIIELIIVRNYTLAVIFITPIPLLLAEMGNSGLSPVSLIEARLIDTWFGCLLGLIATMTLWHRSSSIRIRTVLKDTILLEAEIFEAITQPDTREEQKVSIGSKSQQLQTGLINLHIMQDQALQEFPRHTTSELLWPAVVATARIGYWLLSMMEDMQGISVSNHEREGILQAFQSLSGGVISGMMEGNGAEVQPLLDEFPDIQEAFQALQKSIINPR